MKLFVVLGEKGDYSEREVWVSGVFSTREEAEAKVIEATAQWREHEAWDKRYYAELCRLEPGGVIPSIEAMEKSKRLVGPKPYNSHVERAEIHEVELGQWIESKEE